MDAYELHVTSILRSKEADYRVIYVSNEYCVLCVMDCDTLDLLSVQTEDVLHQISNGLLIVFPTEERRVVDIDAMTPVARKKYTHKRDFIRAVERTYAPTYLGLCGHAKKDDLIAILKDFNIPKNSGWRYIRLFLQSGMDESVLMRKTRDNANIKTYEYKTKTGRKPELIGSNIVVDTQVTEHFQEALALYKSGRSQTIKNAFDHMNAMHYMRTEIDANGCLSRVLMPVSERPTLRQFQYFVRKSLTREEIDRIKTSAREQRNNRRLLLSDNLQNVIGPGDCVEMDEVEVDISLVSQIDSDQVVGRPIVYAMVDVYTRMILAVSVAFDNNSVLGLTNCLMNLAEDKVELCKSYGIQINPGMWPSCIIPRTIRADRGSEYRSKEAKRIFNELNISLELVPGGSGSLKGSVEQLFHQLHSSQNPFLEKKGLIQQRHDSKHHKQATLTIEDFKKILYAFVISHNMTYMKAYPLTRDMISQKVQPIPSELWTYGVTTYGQLRPIGNKEHYIYTLLCPVEAKISRKGIVFKGLYYMDFNDWDLRNRMYTSGNKSTSFEARIDPRDVGALYTLSKDGQLKKIPLNAYRTGNDYQGVTLAEYIELRKAKKTQDKLGAIHNEELRAGVQVINSIAVAEAEVNSPRYANTKNIRDNRAREKRLEQTKLALSHQAVEQDPVTFVPESSVALLTENPKPQQRIITDIDEAFDLFLEGDL